MNLAFAHEPGTAISCLSIPIILHKEGAPGVPETDLKCGFKIGGGIDQDYRKSPQVFITFNLIPRWLRAEFQGYADNGIYVTEIAPNSAASKSGLKVHDKILQLNGYDFTMVTHKKAVDYIKKHTTLNILVARKGVTQT